MDQNNESSKKVAFETKGWWALKYYRETTAPKIVRWVVKNSGGIIKDEKKAGYLLIGFAILAFSISLFLIFNSSESFEQPFDEENEYQNFEVI